MSNFFIVDFCVIGFYNALSKLLKAPKVSKIKQLLVALLDCNSDRNRHAYHGVVTCADEAHHLYASGALAIASG